MRSLALLGLLAGLAVPLPATAEAAGGWSVHTAPAPGPIEAVLHHGSGVYLDLGANGEGGRYHRVHFEADAVVLEALPRFLIVPSERHPDMLPDGVVVTGERGIDEAWLAGPTRRYRHGVLGDGFEASVLKVVDANRLQLSYELPADSVFEDRYPRLADLDGDGVDEVFAVRSYLDRGSALAVFKLARDSLVPLAESEPIGRPQRWLNPIGVGDFDGDGRPEIAVVVTPHIGGILALYELAGDRLVADGRADGFSNHAIGMREMAMSAILDLDGDGVDDLAVPDAGRRALRLVSFAGGQIREFARIAHDDAIASAIQALDLDGDRVLELVYALDNGTVVVLKH